MAKKALAKEKTNQSMVDIAYDILKKEKKPLSFRDVMEKVNKVRNLNEQEYEEQIARLYTTINLDGRFLNVGDGQWGLKHWYPVDQQVEEIAAPSKRKKKKRKEEKHEEDFEEEPLDDFEELDEEDYEEFDDDDEDSSDFDEDDEEDKA